MSELEFEKKMDKKERRFSQEQYDMLKRCLKKKDMKEWNEWRKKNPDEDILLEGATFLNANLQGANFINGYLNEANFEGANLEYAKLCGAHIEYAVLQCCNLTKTDLSGAYVKQANLTCAYLERANLFTANAKMTNLEFANLQGAVLSEADLEQAKLRKANLKNAILYQTNLDGANLEEANLKGANLSYANLSGASFVNANVDWNSVFWWCEIDSKTDFRGVSLHLVRISPKRQQLLEYNIRRLNWEDWYKEHWLLAWLVKPFWLMSDYGMSTVRVVGVFFLLALLFAAVYANWACWRPPGIVSNLIVQPEVGEAGWHYFSRALIRPIYFSVVTMTTLGFGDMYANKGSIAGHVLLILQVILGYVLLAALVTRFAVLFTAGGPAGEFAEEKKETPQ